LSQEASEHWLGWKVCHVKHWLRLYRYSDG